MTTNKLNRARMSDLHVGMTRHVERMALAALAPAVPLHPVPAPRRS